MRHGHADEYFAPVARNQSEPEYRDERPATRAAFLETLAERYGTSLGPFSGGPYGAALRMVTGTRSDTFSLSESLKFVHDPAGEVVNRIDPDYVPDRRQKRF